MAVWLHHRFSNIQPAAAAVARGHLQSASDGKSVPPPHFIMAEGPPSSISFMMGAISGSSFRASILASMSSR